MLPSTLHAYVPLRVDAPAERESGRDDERRATAHEVGARADHECPVQREVHRMRDHALARLDAGEHDGLEPAARVEKPAAQPDIELAARVAVHAFERGAAPLRKTEDTTELRALKRPVGRVE